MSSTPATPSWYKWAGLALSYLPCLLLLVSAAFKFMGGPDFEKGFTEHMGWPMAMAPTIGVLEIVCTVLYLIPRTAVLGAILLAAYMGGAVATHVRVGDPWITQVLVGAALWGGLWFRDARVRALIPFKS